MSPVFRGRLSQSLALPWPSSLTQAFVKPDPGFAAEDPQYCVDHNDPVSGSLSQHWAVPVLRAPAWPSDLPGINRPRAACASRSIHGQSADETVTNNLCAHSPRCWVNTSTVGQRDSIRWKAFETPPDRCRSWGPASRIEEKEWKIFLL